MSLNLNGLVQTAQSVIQTAISNSRTNEELFDYEEEKNRFDINFKKSYLRTRKWVGFFTFLMVWLWLLAILYFIMASALGHLPFLSEEIFNLSESVLIALITTTTVNVVTFLTIVIKNLFPNKK